MSSGGVRRLQGVVEDVERTGEKMMDEEGSSGRSAYTQSSS
jgi:hypothetical protein